MAVLGDMLELGQYEQHGHEMVGIRAAEVVDELVTLGERGKMIANAALEAGLPADKIVILDKAEQAIEYLQPNLKPEDVVLVKGSNLMRMDRIVSALEVPVMRESAYALALAGFSFMLTVIWGEPLLRILRHLKIGESIRVDGPQQHISKSGTPTLGGVLFILPVLLITLLFNAASLIGFTILGRSIFLPMGTLIVFGLLGSIDDWKKLRGKRVDERGMRARTKFLIQIIFGIVIAIGLQYILQAPQIVPALDEPGIYTWVSGTYPSQPYSSSVSPMR